MKEEKSPIYKKWQFWVVVIVLWFTYSISIIILAESEKDCSVCDCSICENELKQCENQITIARNAWKDYVDAFEDYCVTDYTNPLCQTIPAY